jgi:hypothetical protein
MRRVSPCLFCRAAIAVVFISAAHSGVQGQAAPPVAAPAASPRPSALQSQIAAESEADMKRLCALLNVEPLLMRPPYNYDESKANPYPQLPDALVLKNGHKVTNAKTWWTKRRPEILEDFEREVYGRTPKNLPKVTWEVTSTSQGVNGDFPIVAKVLFGHVDNSAYPRISVNIQVTLATPLKTNGPVPVMIQLGPGGFGGPRPIAAPAAGGVAGQTGAAAVQLAVPPAGRPPMGPGGPGWQQQLLAKGWGYATLNTGSVQADNGAGLTSGIIGLANKGQPRKLDDWGVLSAWAWGASRFLDYLETDPAVNAKEVGVEGHSRWGKATVLTMALDQRFAIAYVSSSGEGGARLHRRNFGEPLDAVTIPGEYHWMAGNFLKYTHHWNDLPVDSHELIALCAPRPVFITGGTQDDRGADAKGMFMAAAAAGPVYKLLGKKDLGVTDMPATPNTALIDGDVAFRQHDGGHSDAYDWPTFIQFASKYFATPAVAGAAHSKAGE